MVATRSYFEELVEVIDFFVVAARKTLHRPVAASSMKTGEAEGIELRQMFATTKTNERSSSPCSLASDCSLAQPPSRSDSIGIGDRDLT